MQWSFILLVFTLVYQTIYGIRVDTKTENKIEVNGDSTELIVRNFSPCYKTLDVGKAQDMQIKKFLHTFYTRYATPPYTDDDDDIKKEYCSRRLLLSLDKNLYTSIEESDDSILDVDPFTLTNADINPKFIQEMWIGKDCERKNLYYISFGAIDTIGLVIGSSHIKEYKIESIVINGKRTGKPKYVGKYIFF